MIHPPEVIDVPFENWKKDQFPKIAIVWHFTVSPSCLHYEDRRPGWKGDIAHWSNSKFPLGTSILIDGDGAIYRAFPSSGWANHIGVKSAVFAKYGLPNINRHLQRSTIGIEFINLGPLEPAPDGNGYWTAVKSYQKSKWLKGIRIPSERVMYFPNGWRGYKYYEKLTDEQIEAGLKLSMYWADHYSIPLDYNKDMWSVSRRALSGKPGIWGHCSYRPDKTDLAPQSEVITALKGLKSRYDALKEPVRAVEPPKQGTLPEIPLVLSPEEMKKEQMKNFAANVGGFKYPK